MKKIYSLLLMLVLTLSAKQVNAQCAANFSNNQGINGLESFTDLSSGGVSWWYWDFDEPQSGNANTSNLQNPIHTYQSNGVYNVTLTVWTTNSCTSTYTANVNVTSSQCNLPLYANYTFTTGMNGSFSVTSITTGTTGAATYSWNWGDGGTAIGANATHTYMANGMYNVVLYVTDGLCSDSVDQSIWISTVGCSLVANYVSQSGINGTYDFTSTSTGTSLATTYYWTFGDGGTSSNSITTHNYMNNGTYTVNLYATNPGSCFSTYSNVITVTNATCNLSASFTSTNNLNNYTVTSTSTGTNMSTTYLWAWGDGATSNTPNASHSYTANGYYTMYFVASNGGNCIDSVTQLIVVNNLCNIQGGINVAQQQNGWYNFTAAMQNTNQPYQYNWNFGNGNTGVGPNVTEQYTATGMYTVTLVVTEFSIFPACTATFTAVFGVTCALQANYTYSVLPGGVVNYSSTSTGTSMSTTYSWNYGDGATGSGPTSSHTYSNGGYHYPGLYVWDSPNCVDTLIDSVNVNTIPCISNSNFTVMYSGTPLYWNAIPAYYGNVYAAMWTWGDGNFDYAMFPSHTYSAAGLYNICLTVTTSCGTSSTCTGYNIYRLSAPVNVDQQMVHISVIPNSAVGLKKLTMENAVVNVYPIPSNGKVELKVFDLSTSANSVRTEVYDMLGREVYTNKFEVMNGKFETQLDLQELNNGTYFIKVSSEERTYTSKIIINH